MKKLFTLALTLILIVAALAGCGSSQSTPQSGETAPSTEASEPEYTLKLHTNLSTTDATYQAYEFFKETVEAKTDGRVIIELYPGSALGNTSDCLEGLELRICDIVVDGISNLAAYDDIANLDGLHFMYEDLDHYCAVMDSEAGQEYLKTLGEKTNKVLLGYLTTGARELTATKPIASVADLKGLKLRSPAVPIYADTWTWLGASPTPLAAGDIFTSLQQGVIDGQENPYTTCVGFSIHEVCKYISETNHNYTTLSFMMDKNFYESMPEDIQAALAEAATEAGKKGTEINREMADAKKQEMLDAGCEMVEIDITEWHAAMDGFVEAKYPYLLEWVERFQSVEH